METPPIHPVVQELILKAASEMEDTALECSEIAEQLESGELLAALGVLPGCERTLRTVSVIVRAAHDWQERSSHNPSPPVADA